MQVRGAAALFGLAFGFLLAWTQMTDPDVIRRMLLLEEAYLFLVMCSAMATGFLGLRLLRGVGFRALATREPVGWTVSRPERRHVGGSVLFGAGWGLSYSCPGPIAAQLGQGMLWSLATITGVVIGIVLYARLQPRPPLR
jgi:uncharacterized membrane protein YedE/YeeE